MDLSCVQKKMSDQFDPLDKVQRPHQHLLSRDEHRQAECPSVHAFKEHHSRTTQSKFYQATNGLITSN